MATSAAQRYFAHYTTLGVQWNSSYVSGWQVFDRNCCGIGPQQGEPLAIAFCVNRTVAFRLRDALNEQEAKELVA